MKALARFLRSEGWLVEALAAFALTIGLIAGREPDGGMAARVFGHLFRRLKQRGFNPQDNGALLLLTLLGNLVVFAAVFYAFRMESERLVRRIYACAPLLTRRLIRNVSLVRDERCRAGLV